MKKKLSTLIIIFLTSLFIFSCNNSQSSDKLKNAVANFRNCSADCDNREKACWDEYNKCMGQAATEEQTALNICSHVPPANRAECRSEAVSAYAGKLEVCQRNLKACLAEVRKCREKCGEELSVPPDTR
jgi:hypothetical protein